MERAARRQSGWRWRRAWDGTQRTLGRVQSWHRFQQRLGVRMDGTGEYFLHRSGFHRLTGVHHQHPVRHLGDHAHVVRDDQDRHAQLGPQPREQLQDLRLDRRVQRRGRFVRNHQVRLQGQRHGDQRALAHATGKLVGVMMHAPLGRGHASQRQQPHRLGHRLALGHTAVDHQHLGNLVANRRAGIEAGQRILVDQRHALPADAPALVAGQGAEVDAGQSYLTCYERGRRQQRHHRHRQRRFAGTGFADDGKHLPARDVEADVAHRRHGPSPRPERDVQAADRKNGMLHDGHGRRVTILCRS